MPAGSRQCELNTLHICIHNFISDMTWAFYKIPRHYNIINCQRQSKKINKFISSIFFILKPSLVAQYYN